LKALSLTEPWAFLTALSAKKIETRSWGTSYRGPLLIHAAKGFPVWARDLCQEEPFRSVLYAAGVYTWAALPRGEIIGAGTLVECVTTDSLVRGLWQSAHGHLMTPQETAFGDYSPRRHGFILDGMRRLPEPVPCTGALGLWTVPADVVARIEEQLRGATTR